YLARLAGSAEGLAIATICADARRSTAASTAAKSARAAIGFTRVHSDPCLASCTVVVPLTSSRPSTLSRSIFRIVLSRSAQGGLVNVESRYDDTRKTRF